MFYSCFTVQLLRVTHRRRLTMQFEDPADLALLLLFLRVSLASPMNGIMLNLSLRPPFSSIFQYNIIHTDKIYRAALSGLCAYIWKIILMRKEEEKSSHFMCLKIIFFFSRIKYCFLFKERKIYSLKRSNFQREINLEYIKKHFKNLAFFI